MSRRTNALGLTVPASMVAPRPVPSKSAPTDLATAMPLPTALLVRWNVAMALFHLAFVATTLALGNLGLDVDLYRARLNFSYVDANETAWELVPHYEQRGTLPFTWFVLAFSFLSALFHSLNATLLRAYYLDQLAHCCTPTRWVEYFFSAPTVMVAIAYTLGIRDTAVLIAIAALVATTMPYGYWVEQIARPASPDEWTRPLAQRLLPWALGHVPQLAAWGLVVLQFYDGADTEDKAPAFVHVILWGEATLFFSFGGASLLSQLLPPRLFYRGELLFQLLSLVSKGLLTALLLANVIMLDRFDDAYEP